MESDVGEGIKGNDDASSGDDKSHGVDQNWTEQVAQPSRQLDAKKKEIWLARQVKRFLWRTSSGLVPSIEPALWKQAAVKVSLQVSEGGGSILKDVALNFLC